MILKVCIKLLLTLHVDNTTFRTLYSIAARVTLTYITKIFATVYLSDILHFVYYSFITS